MVLPTTPFVKVVVGYFSPFDHMQKVNQQLTQTKPYNTNLLIAMPLGLEFRRQ